MTFVKNNINFETIKENEKWILKAGSQILETCETEEECVRLSNFYEYIGVPFTVI